MVGGWWVVGRCGECWFWECGLECRLVCRDDGKVEWDAGGVRGLVLGGWGRLSGELRRQESLDRQV